jgi:hypothetical protein
MAVAAATLVGTKAGTQEYYPDQLEVEQMMATVDAHPL